MKKGQRGRRQEGRKEEEEKDDEEGGGEQVNKDVTGWTEVTRKMKRKTVQIFVRVNGSKAAPMEVNLTDDKVEDVMRQIQQDEDVYATMNGKVLKSDEKLKSCGVSDGCTIQVTSRLRGGGKHKDKKGKVGEETSHETGASEERLSGDSGEREGGRRVVRDGVRANEVGDGNHEHVTVDGRRQTSYCGGSERRWPTWRSKRRVEICSAWQKWKKASRNWRRRCKRRMSRQVRRKSREKAEDTQVSSKGGMRRMK